MWFAESSTTRRAPGIDDASSRPSSNGTTRSFRACITSVWTFTVCAASTTSTAPRARNSRTTSSAVVVVRRSSSYHAICWGRAVREEQHAEQVAVRRLITRPPSTDRGDQRLFLLSLAAKPTTSRVPAIQHQIRNPPRMPCRVGNRYRRPLRNAQQHKALQPQPRRSPSPDPPPRSRPTAHPLPPQRARSPARRSAKPCATRQADQANGATLGLPNPAQDGSTTSRPSPAADHDRATHTRYEPIGRNAKTDLSHDPTTLQHTSNQRYTPSQPDTQAYDQNSRKSVRRSRRHLSSDATVLHLMSQLSDGGNDESTTSDDQADPLRLVRSIERWT